MYDVRASSMVGLPHNTNAKIILTVDRHYFVLTYFHLLIYLFTLFTIVYQYSKVYSLEFTTLVNVFTFTCICVNSLLSFTSPFFKKNMAISAKSENSNVPVGKFQTFGIIFNRIFSFLFIF